MGDNRCSHLVLFALQSKNNVRGMKTYHGVILTQQLEAINHDIQYFSTAAPHRGSAWRCELDHLQKSRWCISYKKQSTKWSLLLPQ